jgi:hypothetical protein
MMSTLTIELPDGMKPASDLQGSPSRVGNASADEVMRTCLICGKRLEERKCKLFCPDPRCGYFLSCADYY